VHPWLCPAAGRGIGWEGHSQGDLVAAGAAGPVERFATASLDASASIVRGAGGPRGARHSGCRSPQRPDAMGASAFR